MWKPPQFRLRVERSSLALRRLRTDINMVVVRVEVRKAEYRSVCREWHTFLDFQPASLPLRKHTLQDMDDHHRPTCKRTKTYDLLFR